MDASVIRLMDEYTRWADARAFDAVAKLNPDQYVKDLGSSHKSVRDTLVHIISAQWIWLSRWKGTSPKAMWDPAEFPTVDAVRGRWEQVSRERADFIGAQTPESLDRPLSYQNLKGESLSTPLGPLMLHVFNHSSYHRGQITTLLRQLGATPVNTDLAAYLRERSKPS